MPFEAWVIIVGLLLFVASLALALAVSKWQIVIIGGVILALSVIPAIRTSAIRDQNCRDAGGTPVREACVDSRYLIPVEPPRTP